MSLLDEQNKLRVRRGLDELPRALNRRLTNPAYHAQLNGGKAEAVVKVISYVNGARVKQLLVYVARAEEKGKDQGDSEEAGQDRRGLVLETEDGRAHRGKDAIHHLLEDWRKDFEQKPRGAKRSPRHTTHIMLSAAAPNDDRTAAKVCQAARELLRKEFGDLDYQYAFSLHRDTQHPHVHVVIKNYNRTLESKLRLNREELFHLRQEFASELERQGVEQVATLRKDRTPLLARVAKGVEELKKRDVWYKQKLKTAPGQSVDALGQRRAAARTLARLKDDVKANTLPLTKTRKTLMRDLRDLSRTLVERTPAQFKDDVAKTIAGLGQGCEYLARGLNELRSERLHEVAPSPQRHAQAKQRKRVLEAFAGRYQRDVDRAIKDIKQDKTIGLVEKTKLSRQLTNHARTVGRLIRDRGLER